MTGDLKGHVALITGASRGIGKATALELAARGAHLVLAARTEEPRAATPGTLNETAELLRAQGNDPLIVRADVALAEDLDALLAAAFARHGHVDILVNNAAYTVGKAIWTQVPDIGREQWEKGFAVNVTAPLMLIQGVWPSMVQRGGGVIVNVTSGAAQLQPLETGTTRLVGSDLGDNGPLYGATKAALDRMANVIAFEGRPHNIAVINLTPGLVLTETMALTLTTQGVSVETGFRDPSVPAKAIAWLCSCPDPMLYSGQIVDGPALHDQLGLG